MPCFLPIVNVGSRRPVSPVWFWIIPALLLVPAEASAQKSEDCMICHSDKTLTMQKGGRTVPLFVDAARLKNSAHGSADCVDCHSGFKPDETPHAKVIRPVDCQGCHDIIAYPKSIHG